MLKSAYIQTPRLTMAPLEVERDWQTIARIGGDKRVAPMMASLRSPWAEADVRTWITRSLWRGVLGFRLGVWLKDGALIGTVGLGGEAPDTSTAYFLDPGHWGQGLMTEAMAGFLPHMMRVFAIETVIADHFADNPTSGAVLRKLGFEKTGEGQGESLARLEPAANVHYRLMQHNLKV